MAKKATHTGTCQSCGRRQKLPGGRLSKHGYTVDWGYFNGICSGAEHKPLEEDRTILDRTVQLLNDHAEYLENNEPTKVRCPVADKAGTWSQKRVEVLVENDWDAFLKLAREHQDQWTRHGWYTEEYVRKAFDQYVKYAKADMASKARHARAHAKFLLELAEKVHGSDLVAIVEENKAPETQEIPLTVRGGHFVLHCTKDGKRWCGHLTLKGARVWTLNSTRTKKDLLFAARYHAKKHMTATA